MLRKAKQTYFEARAFRSRLDFFSDEIYSNLPTRMRKVAINRV
jgi:hypothetical protein